MNIVLNSISRGNLNVKQPSGAGPSRWLPGMVTAGALTLSTLAIFAFALVVGPRWLAEADISFSLEYSEQMTPRALQAIDGARTKLVQIALGAAVVTSGYIAWRRLHLDRRAAQLAEDRLRLDQQSQVFDRVERATARLSTAKSEVRYTGIVEIGSIMQEMDGHSQSLAHQLAVLIGSTAVELSQMTPRQADIPRELIACLNAFESLDPHSTLWLDLRGGNFDGWTLDLPSRQEVDMRNASLRGSVLCGLDSHVRLEGANTQDASISPALVMVAELSQDL